MQEIILKIKYLDEDYQKDLQALTQYLLMDEVIRPGTSDQSFLGYKISSEKFLY